MSPHLDSEQVILRLQRLKEYYKILKLIQKFSLKEIQTDPFKTGSLLHYLQLSIEVCIDVGQMIISAEGFKIPDKSAEVFLILGKEKILPARLAEKMAPLGGFRNLIVHEYAEIEMERVYKHLKNELSDFENFTKAIARYVNKK